MNKIPERGITYKTSRVAYVQNYILAALLLVLFVLIYLNYPLNFTFFPKTPGEFTPTMIIFIFLIFITFMIEEPTIEQIIRKYIVTNNEVVKIEGLLRKNRITIPYQGVADVRVNKGIVGRIFNFGDIEVTGFKDAIIMKGIRNPEVIHKIIQNKIGMTRSRSYFIRRPTAHPSGEGK